MTSLTYRVLLCIALTFPACSFSNGFDRAEIQDALQYRRVLPNDPSSASGTEPASATLKPPIRLGLYFVRTQFPTRQSIQTLEWLGTEQDRLLQRLAPLRADHTASEIVVLADSTLAKPDRQTLRQTCTRYGLDVLAIVDGVGSVDRYNKLSSLLYLTILGAYIIPGTVSDALFTIDATLWDVRHDRLLDRVTAEGRANKTGSAVRLEDEEPLREAQQVALEALSNQIIDVLHRRIRMQPQPASP